MLGWSSRDGLPRVSPPLPPNTVAKSTPQQKHLKLYTEQPPKPVRPPTEAIACLPDLLASVPNGHGLLATV